MSRFKGTLQRLVKYKDIESMAILDSGDGIRIATKPV